MPKISWILSAALLIATLIYLIVTAHSPSLAQAQSQPGDPAAGQVLLIKSSSPAFDRYTNSPSLAQQQWLQQHYARMLVFSPYFDSRTSWYGNGLIYMDSYAIYTNSLTAGLDVLNVKPEWILRDNAGNPLYIPWGCDTNAHVCPQYAGDISNLDFRQWWIDWARTQLSQGTYAGLWIDDVNLDWRISNGDGAPVVPIDHNTGVPMNIADWRRYFAEFLEEIRSSLPNVEIVHNSIWYAGAPSRDSDQYVHREILSADTINVEHGVNDSGLTNGTGQWSLEALLRFIERANQNGKRVQLGGLGPSDQVSSTTAEYTLACYFLVSNGSNRIADGSFSTPSNWWTGFDTDLGTPLSARQNWNGLLRRDFSRGMVLVNPPRSNSAAAQLPAPMRILSGATVSSVNLDGGHGIVLLR